MQPLDVLQKYWGYPAFREPQAEIIQSVLDGSDTLALMPTGGGKSICFQVPALLREGVCLVVSPLIALMKDQVEQLRKRNIAAAAVYSGMHRREIDRLFDNAVYGSLKFLYVSPERLQTELARARIAQMNVNLIAVDEAHCVSQWGYDFRPPYLQIPETRDLHPKVPCLALTASATPKVVEDIQEKLDFRRDARVVRKSFARPNLAYVVLPGERKGKQMLDVLNGVPGTSIVYVRSRKKTKQYAAALAKRGFSAEFYHAGLSPDDRAHRQTQWIGGHKRVMVTTNAFGMGIDKPDVRSVVHLDLPDSLEAYFQEAGRGGRDGEKSYAVLLVDEQDKLQLRRGLEQNFPPLAFIKRTYQALGSYLQLATGGGAYRSFDFELVEFARRFELDVRQTYAALKILEQSGWLLMNEGVFVPAKAKILLDRHRLYDYQLRNQRADPILKALMRLYPGILSEFTTVQEQQVAGWIKMSVVDFKQTMRKLHQDRVLVYEESRDKPQLTLLRDRVRTENLTIDQQLYHFRRERYRTNVASVIHYVEAVRCRSQLLLEYFSETDTEPCGQCDVCLGRTKPHPAERRAAADELERYTEKLRLLLRREPLHRADILESFAPRHREVVGQTVDHLTGEGELLPDERGRLRFRA